MGMCYARLSGPKWKGSNCFSGIAFATLSSSITISISIPNSTNICRHNPHGYAGGLSAIALNLRWLAATAADTADISAQSDPP